MGVNDIGLKGSFSTQKQGAEIRLVTLQHLGLMNGSMKWIGNVWKIYTKPIQGGLELFVMEIGELLKG